MGADSVHALAGEKYSDRSDAPLLPKGTEECQNLSDSAQPPRPVVAVQRDSETANGMADRAAAGEGYQTSLCDCCAEPGGSTLCELYLRLLTLREIHHFTSNC